MKPIYLHNPTYLQLDDTYRSLPLLGSVQVKTSNFGQTIQDLEKIGFVAIKIQGFSSEHRDQTIRAYKGKHGPCYFTGKKVGYRGAAMVALDDDNHILFANELKDVCDKTFRVLDLDPYKGLVYGQGDFEENPVKDNEKDDFESSQVRLYEQLKNITEHSGQRKVLFYPGPFRVLILSDGTMVYRGKWCSVPANQSNDLIKKDRCVETEDVYEGLETYFQNEYETSGSTCLMRTFIPEPTLKAEYEQDLSKLSGISEKFKERLVNVIDNHRKYFILIGNEMDDKLGCCPSEEVTEANKLVRYGILSSLAEPVQGDSCPVTIYAFKDELSVSGKSFSSKINEDLRRSIKTTLRKSPPSRLSDILKWVLLIFIMISLGIAARKCQSLQFNDKQQSLYEQLNPATNVHYMILLFHNKKRCYQCLQMEKYTGDLIKTLNDTDIETKGLVFKTVVIDDPVNASMVNRFGIFAPTLVLLEFDQREIVNSNVLFDLTGMYRDEEAFKTKLDSEIHRFMTKEYE